MIVRKIQYQRKCRGCYTLFTTPIDKRKYCDKCDRLIKNDKNAKMQKM